MTTTREAVGDLFQVRGNRLSAVTPRDAIFPGNDGLVVRLADGGEREATDLSWGFVLPQKDRAPKRVTNMRDDKIRSSPFWRGSFAERRCLVPVTSFAEPKGRAPARWHWFALTNGAERPLFAFAGIWRSTTGPIKKDGEPVSIDTYAFATTRPNKIVATIHPSRMPVILVDTDAHETWLNGSEDEAFELIRSYPADAMQIVQAGTEKRDLLGEDASARCAKE